MKILLIDIDSKIPNLALKKIEKYHLDQGDEVIWDMPLFAHLSDKIYVSVIFDRNQPEVMKQWHGRAEIGGTGFNAKTKLPSYIDKIRPHINLGFTTRGCIRKCEFCIVPSKEGKIKRYRNLLELWDGKSKDIILLDNNILALPNHFKSVCKEARDNNIRLDFNQGLDCRLLTQDIVDNLKTIKHKELRFAWDDLSYEKDVIKTIDLLDEQRCTWYLLTGFNTTFKEDLYRAEYLRSRNQVAFVMRYNFSKDRKLIPLSQWVNKRNWFRAMTWREFLKTDFCVARGYDKLN